jgi:CheY-like chemotaxis protein
MIIGLLFTEQLLIKPLIFMIINGEIILIDDEKFEEEFLNEALETLSYKVKVVYFDHAMAALNYIRDTNKDIFLIISDIHMGDISGIKFKEMLNSDPNTKLKSIPFVFTTNHASKKNIDEAYKHNIQGFFKKPVGLKNFTELFATIVKYWLINLHPNKGEFFYDKEANNFFSV